MTPTLHVELDSAEGSLPRLIGLIERRGFHIDKMVLGGDRDTRIVSIDVQPRDANRSVQVLGRQIDRLYGMRRVTA